MNLNAKQLNKHIHHHKLSWFSLVTRRLTRVILFLLKPNVSPILRHSTEKCSVQNPLRAVSYTHLDVYKRQSLSSVGRNGREA